MKAKWYFEKLMCALGRRKRSFGDYVALFILFYEEYFQEEREYLLCTCLRHPMCPGTFNEKLLLYGFILTGVSQTLVGNVLTPRTSLANFRLIPRDSAPLNQKERRVTWLKTLKSQFNFANED